MTKRPAPRRHMPTSPFKAPAEPPLKHFAPGDRVSHDRHGLGRVVAMEPASETAVVDFGTYQVRIVTPYRGMHKL
ncbi:hypothetical protein V1460_18450 [Streptomyces sp. SCSIO 30461]|uniref:hypothetical protein n=1 Tax=Streptomyces sp. SCSIO 30461 TaxID=3118085 RepID=UPI0030D29CAE